MNTKIVVGSLGGITGLLFLLFVVNAVLYFTCSDIKVISYNPTEWLANISELSTCQKSFGVINWLILIISIIAIIAFAVSTIKAYRAL